MGKNNQNPSKKVTKLGTTLGLVLSLTALVVVANSNLKNFEPRQLSESQINQKTDLQSTHAFNNFHSSLNI